jgi:hypothetical protein
MNGQIRMRIARRLSLAILWLLTSIATRADEPFGATAQANRDKIYLGESIILNVRVRGTDTPDMPDLSGIRDARVLFLGSQNDSQLHVIVVNDKVEKRGFTGRTFTFQVTPEKTGTVPMGPIRVTHAGQSRTIQGPAIQVTGVEDQDYVRIDLVPSRTEVLVDEPFDITLRVRIRALAKPFDDMEPLLPHKQPRLDAGFLSGDPIDGLAIPDMRNELNARIIRDARLPGFGINDFTLQVNPFDFDSIFDPMGRRGKQYARFALPRHAVTIDGKPYHEYTLTLTYTPEKEGSYTFGPLIFKGDIVVGVTSQRNPVEETIFAVGPAATVRVVPPPESGRPVAYIGAIGSHLIADAQLDTQTCKVGDPLTLTLKIAGKVSLKNIVRPILGLQPDLSQDFRIYDDTAQTRTGSDHVLFSWMVRPLREGTLEFPPIEIGYYDVQQRAYRTVKTQPLPVRANAAAEINTDRIFAGLTNQADRLAQDLTRIRPPAPLVWAETGCEREALFMTPVAGILFIVGPVFMALALGGRFALRLLLTHVSFIRRWQLIRQARRDLLHAATSSNPHERLDQLAVSAIRRELAVRMHLDARSLMPADILKHLDDHGINPEHARRLAAHLQALFDLSFAATPPDARIVRDTAMESLKLLKAMPRRPARKSMPASSAFIAAAIITAAAGSSTAQAVPRGEDVFQWTEANTHMAAADTPDQFREAAKRYQIMIRSGVRNGDLFYNYGTALLLAEDFENARLALERAEQYRGATPEIRRNMALAASKGQSTSADALPWSRYIFAWHYAVPARWRMTLFAAVWSLAIIAVTLRALGVPVAGRGGRTLLLILLGLIGSSLLASMHVEHEADNRMSMILTESDGKDGPET